MKVTVGICSYKQKKWLYRCLRSLSSQTLDPSEFEVVIVNDDPDENIDDIVDSMRCCLNIRLIDNRKNIGLPSSLNKILTTAKGRYFVRVDSDDYVSKHFLHTLTLILDMNRRHQAVSCDYNKVNDVGLVLSTHSYELEPIACGIMFTYESLCDVGFYNENFKMREGHELLQRFKEKFEIFYLPIPLYRYRIHNENRTNNVDEVSKFDSMLKNH